MGDPDNNPVDYGRDIIFRIDQSARRPVDRP